MPTINRQHYELFTYCPSIWKRGYEGRIDHIPLFAVVLLLLIQDLINTSTTLTHCETSEFSKNMWRCHICFGTGYVNLIKDFVNHILIIIFKVQGIFDWKSPANIQAVQRRTDLFQSYINL